MVKVIDDRSMAVQNARTETQGKRDWLIDSPWDGRLDVVSAFQPRLNRLILGGHPVFRYPLNLEHLCPAIHHPHRSFRL